MRRACAVVLLGLAAWQGALAQTAENPPAAPKPDKSTAIPAAEIIAFDLLLNLVNRRVSGTSDYDVTTGSIRRNLRGPWIVDNDPFKVNQFAHPYQGAMYHGAGRSAGLSYWESAALTFAGSAMWEIAGEKTPPSRNDQIASGIAGSFLGEPLFRMAHLLMSDRSGLASAWRPWLSALASPPVALNKLAFGSRFDGAFYDNDPSYYGRLRIGRTRAVQHDFDTPQDYKIYVTEIEMALDYGLPGSDGYTYKRPFDYFSTRIKLTNTNSVEDLSTTGLLYGTDYALGKNYRGIWGLYANYDYVAPQIFHASMTSVSIGSTGQWWLMRSVALQGTVLAGLGYAAASDSHATPNDRAYHYGAATRFTAALRTIVGDDLALDVMARMVSMGKFDRRGAGRDEIARVDTAMTWRVQGRHALGLNYAWSHRSTSSPVVSGRRQTLGRVGVFYTLVGRDGSGSVEWRPVAER